MIEYPVGGDYIAPVCMIERKRSRADSCPLAKWRYSLWLDVSKLKTRDWRVVNSQGAPTPGPSFASEMLQDESQPYAIPVQHGTPVQHHNGGVMSLRA